MLNGSSIFGAAGVSMVDGIKVTGVTPAKWRDIHTVKAYHDGACS